MARPGQDSPGVTRSGWQDMAWTGRARCGRLAGSGVVRRRDARIRRHGATWTTRRDTERLARSGVDSHREARIRRQGDAGTGIARFGSAGMAAQGRAPSVPARLAWICIAAIGWDCPGAAGMARWACNVAAGMDRHDQVGVKPRGRHGTDWLCRASLCVAGLARHGNALLGLLRQAWQRTLRRGRAGMAGSGESQQGRHGLSRRRPVRQGLAGTARDHTVPQRTAGTARHGGADL